MGVVFLCFLCTCLPSLATLEWIDQQNFAKTKVRYRPVARFQYLVWHNKFLRGQDFCFYYMFETFFSGRNKIWGGTKEIWGHRPRMPPVATGLIRYISLPPNLNAIVGITSYYCVILKMVILHDAIKTIQNGVWFFWKEQKPVSLKKQKHLDFEKNKKTRWVEFKKTRVFLNPGHLSILFFWFCLDRTIRNKSHYYQFAWVCAAHLEHKSLILKKLRITGIWMHKN